ncbi:hypothetical protein GOV09_03015 [Candidatus Woesearchaeota archaeon]|nr:hypothetical protein [Candidatus Woesearchaeota archaeon]
MVKKKSKGKQKAKSAAYTIILAIIVIGVFSYLLINELDRQPVTQALVMVNDEAISQADLDGEYDSLPVTLQAQITKEDFLEQMIDRALLFQEADTLGITVNEGEIAEEISQIKLQFPTDDAFEEALDNQGVTIDALEGQVADQLTINKLLNQTILPQIEVTEREIEEYYELNKGQMIDAEGNQISVEEVSEGIRSVLYRQKSADSVEVFLQQLRVNADIVYDRGERNEFLMLEDELCLEDGKPIIRVYTSTTCEKCNLDVFEQVAAEYDVAVYEWQLDTGDNLVTREIEETLSQEEFQVLMEYNPDVAVPSYVFGCKYIRYGNAFPDGNAKEEGRAFREILDQLV